MFQQSFVPTEIFEYIMAYMLVNVSVNVGCNSSSLHRGPEKIIWDMVLELYVLFE